MISWSHACSRSILTHSSLLGRRACFELVAVNACVPPRVRDDPQSALEGPLKGFPALVPIHEYRQSRDFRVRLITYGDIAVREVIDLARDLLRADHYEDILPLDRRQR